MQNKTLQSARSILRILSRETRGSEIAEAAAVLPVMFTMILGIFWFGQAFSIYGTITRAAQEGARAGASPYCTTCSGTNSPAQRAANAEAAVQAALTIAKLDPAKTRRPPPIFFRSCGASTSCDSGSAKVCVQNPVRLNDPGSSSVCGISVAFQYPFQFHLPFTSLDNQRIWMTASARVRLETQ